MNQIVFNYSDEEFIPSKNGIYIKRFSCHQDDAFVYAIKEFLEERNYDGICYVGEERGEIPFENINQEYWDKAVMKYTTNVIIFMSGKEYSLANDDVKQYLMYSYELTKKRKKNIIYNYIRYDAGSDEDYQELKRLINRILDIMEKES